jgi:hypothetical protein
MTWILSALSDVFVYAFGAVPLLVYLFSILVRVF